MFPVNMLTQLNISSDLVLQLLLLKLTDAIGSRNRQLDNVFVTSLSYFACMHCLWVFGIQLRQIHEILVH